MIHADDAFTMDGRTHTHTRTHTQESKYRPPPILNGGLGIPTILVIKKDDSTDKVLFKNLKNVILISELARPSRP